MSMDSENKAIAAETPLSEPQGAEKAAPMTAAERAKAYRARKKAEQARKQTYYIPADFLAKEGDGSGIIEEDELDTRHTTYLAIFYPESAPEDWPDYIERTGCKVWVALHDEDTWDEKDEKRNPEHKAGTKKKPHYHMIWQYDSKQTVRQFARDVKYLNGCHEVKVCMSLCGSEQYLTHKNSPGKHQYDRSIIQLFGGADMSLYDMPTAEQAKEIRGAIYAFLASHPDMVELSGEGGFVEYMLQNEYDWFLLYTSEGLVGIRARELLASNRGIQERKQKRQSEEMERQHRANEREYRGEAWTGFCEKQAETRNRIAECKARDKAIREAPNPFDTIMDTGKYAGMTYRDIVDIDMDYAEQLVMNEGTDEERRRLFISLIECHKSMKGE